MNDRIMIRYYHITYFASVPCGSKKGRGISFEMFDLCDNSKFINEIGSFLVFWRQFYPFFKSCEKI